jgi:phosphatidylglycerol---prolipoprotein diacylglyceryl transferase
LHPILFSLGPFHLRAYGLALALSFLLGSGLALRRGRPRGYSEDQLLGLFWWIVIAAVLGARLNYILAHPEQFAGLRDALRIWEGGLIQYGGLIAAMVASWIYLRRHKLPFLPVADVLAPSLALGEAITRIGCFVNGCCFGRACQTALAVHYPSDSYAAQALGPGVPVCPSQLYLCAGFLLATVVLLQAEKRVRMAPGGLIGLYLILQGAIRYLVDFTRYYDSDDRITTLSPLIQSRSQVIALGLLAFGLVVVIWGVRARAAVNTVGRAQP